jgi:hypothetical protein
LCSLINTFGLPPALGKLKYISKFIRLHIASQRASGLILVYFIFGAWDLVGFVVIYIFAVETKQVSPEKGKSIYEPYWWLSSLLKRCLMYSKLGIPRRGVSSLLLLLDRGLELKERLAGLKVVWYDAEEGSIREDR